MKKTFSKGLACLMSVAIAASCVCTTAFAADIAGIQDPTDSEHFSYEANGVNADDTEGMRAEGSTETVNTNPIVYPVGTHSYYHCDTDTGVITYADKEDTPVDGLSAEEAREYWTAIPSAARAGTEANEDNIAYGMYMTETDKEVHFVDLADCDLDGNGVYTWFHGTKDSATVSTTVDEATNEDPSMSTEFYLNIENGTDGTVPSTEEKITEVKTPDKRVAYDITVSTALSYQLKATVPMYVCMYGFRGTGDIVEPTSDAYRLKNYSTVNAASKATIVDITKVTHYAQILDEDHANEELFAIAFTPDGSTDDGSGTYTYWYTEPDEATQELYPNYKEISDLHINASGQNYVIYIDDEWSFKAAGALTGDALYETVEAVEDEHPLSEDFKFTYEYGEDSEEIYNFKTTPYVNQVVEGGETVGLALKVTELQATPATWRLVPTSTPSSSMKQGEISMSLAPEKAQYNSSAVDLSDCSLSLDITENGWYLAAPAVNGTTVETPTELGIITNAKMAGSNVNDAGCTSVVRVTYTLTPMFGITSGQTATVEADAIDSNR